MRWQGRRESTNINDMRDSGGGLGGGLGGGGFGGGGPFIVRRAGGGIGTIIVVLIVAWLLGINPMTLLSGGDVQSTGSYQQGQGTQQPGARAPANDQMRSFVATVLADTEDTWKELLPQQAGVQYRDPTLTLFSGAVQSGCGTATTASGPFYCPNDENVYIDLNFYTELKQRFGASGDFAQAYVLAHEVGHHVQKLLGILERAQARQSGQVGAGGLSVRTELQADCFAGIWANHTKTEGILEPGDVDEALSAAAAVGDDTIQRRTQGYVVPDSFTHGSSAQRKRWFMAGFQSGRLDSCDTFSGNI
jgi:predicted metalloprotease